MKDYIFIKIQNYYNHKLIAEIDTLKNTNLKFECCGVTGSFLAPSSLPNSFDVITTNNIHFQFPDKAVDKYDNITCEGQNIAVTFSPCSKIHILGLCEWGDFKEIVKLVFEDNSYEELTVSFYDWRKTGAIFDFDIKMNCNIALKAEESGNSSSFMYIHYITCQTKYVNKRIAYLKLPFNPNMHIFAITLEN